MRPFNEAYSGKQIKNISRRNRLLIKRILKFKHIQQKMLQKLKQKKLKLHPQRRILSEHTVRLNVKKYSSNEC